MAMKEVSQAKYTAMMRKSMGLRSCPNCGGEGNVVVRMFPTEEAGAVVQCEHCGNRTRLFSIDVWINCEGLTAYPINERSLMRGIRSAMQSWNDAAEKAAKARKGWG